MIKTDELVIGGAGQLQGEPGGQKLETASQKLLDIEYHRLAAESYDASVTKYFHFYHLYSLFPWVRRLVHRIPDAEALDIGTGTGVLACIIAELGCRVRAIDHSPEMLAIAESRIK